jgi:hypothetical protein
VSDDDDDDDDDIDDSDPDLAHVSLAHSRRYVCGCVGVWVCVCVCGCVCIKTHTHTHTHKGCQDCRLAPRRLLWMGMAVGVGRVSFFLLVAGLAVACYLSLFFMNLKNGLTFLYYCIVII